MAMRQESEEALAVLMNRWKPAERKARAARQACTDQYAAALAGHSSGPTMEQLASAERLEADADRIWAQVESLTCLHLITKPLNPQRPASQRVPDPLRSGA